jgi:anti-sigma B factor antagonist
VSAGDARAAYSPSSALQVSREDTQDALVLMFTGELDITTLPLARAELVDAERGNSQVLVVDLSRLRFMDSSGVRLVLQADSRARDANRRLVIIPGERPRRVFELLGLLNRLELVSSRAEAVEQL